MSALQTSDALGSMFDLVRRTRLPEHCIIELPAKTEGAGDFGNSDQPPSCQPGQRAVLIETFEAEGPQFGGPRIDTPRTRGIHRSLAPACQWPTSAVPQIGTCDADISAVHPPEMVMFLLRKAVFSADR